MFENSIIEFKRSIKLARNKFALLGNKMEDISDFTKDFHLQTDKLE